MLSRLGKLALLCALVAALTPPAGAFHNPAPVLAQDTFSGSGWAAYRFQVTQTARVDLEGYSSFAGSPVYIASWTRNAAGQAGGAALFGFSGGDTYVHAELAETEIIDERSASGAGNVGGAIGLNFQPGEYIGIIAVASPTPVSGTITLFAGPGVTLLARTSGAGAFADLTPDFGGQLNVSAEARGTAGGRAILNGSASHSAQNSMFAWFLDLTFPLAVTTLGVDGPSGSQTGGTFYLVNGGAAGDYKFRVDSSVGASVLFRPEIAAVGADVVLPLVRPEP